MIICLFAAMTMEIAPAIIPAPVSVLRGSGEFRINQETTFVVPEEFEDVARMVKEFLEPATGFELGRAAIARGNAISFKENASLPDEGYELRVTEDGIEIESKDAAGAFYVIQTLRQLLPPQVFKSVRQNADWVIPCVTISDYPRFRWRGAHLDVARHFMPKEFVLRYLDPLALHKLNVFHWHLTEDQGWRIEIKKYPRLTEVGAWRKDTMLTYDPPTYEGNPHGGFYTQDEIREVVKYAKNRFITIVPEIEMPGHCQAAIAAYPQLGNTREQLEVGTRWGVYENVFNVEDSTIRFLQDVVDEVMALFPGKFIHVGGDEVPKVQWNQSEQAQAKMKNLGLANESELQSWFIRQMDVYLAGKGRRLIGWSEILEGGLAPGAALMVWLGDEGAMEAVFSGHDVVMAQHTHTYFDHYQSEDRTNEPHAIGGFLPVSKVYEYEPILSKMTPEQAKHVLGVQFQAWTEYIRTPKQVEYMVFPRACALAEVAWSPKESRNFEAFMQRLAIHLTRLDALEVAYRKG